MSIEVMTAVWKLDLPRDEKIVLLAFADHADDDGFCFPSVGRIAWKCGYSTRSIQRKISDLVNERKILQIVGVEDHKNGKPTRYRVLPSKGTVLPPFIAKTFRDKLSPGDTGGATPGDTGGAQAPDTAVSPESSVSNRHTETSETPLPPSGVRVLTPEEAAPEWMHAAWQEALGGPRPHKLTKRRREVYSGMFSEQLKGTPDPVYAFRLILAGVKRQDYLNKPAFQTPESLFKNEERRERRVDEAMEEINKSARRVQAADDFVATMRARREARTNGSQRV